MIRITIESIDDEFQDSSQTRSITIREDPDGGCVGRVLADVIESHRRDLLGGSYRTMATAILSMEPDRESAVNLWEELRHAAIQYDKFFVDMMESGRSKT